MTYRESDAFRASRAKTVRKRYWRHPEKARQRVRKAREREAARDLLERLDRVLHALEDDMGLNDWGVP
jgi:hypothetical protein